MNKKGEGAFAKNIFMLIAAIALIIGGFASAYPSMIGVGFLVLIGFFIMYAMDKMDENKAAANQAPAPASTPKISSNQPEEKSVKCRFCKKYYSSEFNGCPYCKKK